MTVYIKFSFVSLFQLQTHPQLDTHIIKAPEMPNNETTKLLLKSFSLLVNINNNHNLYSQLSVTEMEKSCITNLWLNERKILLIYVKFYKTIHALTEYLS